MTTHYIDNASSGSQYYFNNSNNATTSTSSSQAYRTYTSPVTSTYNPSGYATYPAVSHDISRSRSPNQQFRLENSYNVSPQFQSVAGFDRNASRQSYQVPQSPGPQVRASVRIIGSQDQYQLPQQKQAAPQQHHFQFDSHQQPGQPTGLPVVYQTPGAAQFTHHNVDLWTENPSQSQDHYVQAQRVAVRSISTGSPQKSQSISPTRNQDHLQQYYSQLTPEQHQQLLRQQHLQRQQEQNSFHDQPQQRPVIVQQVSPPSTYQQDSHRSTAGFGGGQQYQKPPPQQQRTRSESERQRQDEQEYYTAQRQMAIQRAQQQQEEESLSHPVGIRNLASKFAAPAPASGYPPRSRSTSSRQYSNSSYTTNPAPSQTTRTTRTLTSHSMTYSALPKPHEPPVNSVEYYQMQQQSGNSFANIQQAAAPAHIQQTAAGLGPLRDRFKTGSLSEDFNRTQISPRQPPPQQQQQQQQPTNAAGHSLSSIRNQYMNRTKESSQDEYPTQQAYNISRTIVGEDIPQPKQQQQQQPPQTTPAKPENIQQEQVQNESNEQTAPSSEEAASPPTNDPPTAEEEVAPVAAADTAN